MEEVKSSADMAREYCESIADEIRLLEEVLTTADDDYACEECGENRVTCVSLYGPSASVCELCGEIESSDYGYGYEVGDTHADCGGVFHGNQRHDYRRGLAELFRYELSEDPDEAPTIADYVNGAALDLTALGEFSTTGNGWNVTGCEVLRSAGGPGCTITADWNDTLAVLVNWGGSESKIYPYAPTVTEALLELANEIAGGY
jgi:hypothetical protein